MKSQETYHFYLPDGRTCHGTIEDGLKAGAYPSVTTAISIIRKEHVEKWKIRENIGIARRLPIKPGETEREFADRCIKHADILQQVTSDFGTRVHKGIEEFHLQHILWKQGEIKECPTALSASLHDPDVREWMVQYVTWFHRNVESVQYSETTSVSNRHQYAGQIDAVVTLLNKRKAILDFKTQKFKEKLPWKKFKPKVAVPDSPAGKEPTTYWPPSFYETWLLQLCAYKESFFEQTEILVDDVVSLAINSQDPTPIQAKIWDPREHQGGFNAFLHVLDTWKWVNNYQPKKI